MRGVTLVLFSLILIGFIRLSMTSKLLFGSWSGYRVIFFLRRLVTV